MKFKILATVICIISLLQLGCKKENHSNEIPQSLKKMISESSFFSDFCSITSSEPELDFGLGRDTSNNLYVYTQSQLNAGLSNFYANFQYKDTGTVQNLDSSKEMLTINQLIELFSVLETDTSLHYEKDSNYSALRLHFGMEGKKIILIYEPIVLKPTIVPKECTVVGTNSYYRIDSLDNLIPISSSTQSILVNNLRDGSSKIHITHPYNPTTCNFINNYDSTGDIRSNIVSFQQISKMYCDNTQGVSLTDKINFTIVANQNASYTSNYRMHVVPNFRLGLSSPVTGTYKNYGADYLEMCPVKCNIVSISLYY